MAPKKVGVSLDDHHIDAVEQFQREMGLPSFSAAMQVMIGQFTKLRAAALSEVSGTAAAILIGAPSVPPASAAPEPTRGRDANGGAA